MNSLSDGYFHKKDKNMEFAKEAGLPAYGNMNWNHISYLGGPDVKFDISELVGENNYMHRKV